MSDTNATVIITVNGKPVEFFAPEVTTDNDSDPIDADKAWTYRKVSFPSRGVKTIVATVTDASGSSEATQRIGVQDFRLSGGSKNIVLLIGDDGGRSGRGAIQELLRSDRHLLQNGALVEH